MEPSFFARNPELAEYFYTLPAAVQLQLLDKDVEISTVGEFKIIAENLREQELDS